MQATISGRSRLIPDSPSWPHNEIASAGNDDIRGSLESVYGYEIHSTVYNESELELGDCLVSELKLRASSAERFEALLILSLRDVWPASQVLCAPLQAAYPRKNGMDREAF